MVYSFLLAPLASVDYSSSTLFYGEFHYLQCIIICIELNAHALLTFLLTIRDHFDDSLLRGFLALSHVKKSSDLLGV